MQHKNSPPLPYDALSPPPTLCIQNAVYCPSHYGGKSRPYRQGHPIELECNGRCLYVDDDHLSPTGARFVVQHWEQELIRLLTRPESEPSGT